MGDRAVDVLAGITSGHRGTRGAQVDCRPLFERSFAGTRRIVSAFGLAAAAGYDRPARTLPGWVPSEE
jgi:hypothetical protein